MSKEAVQAFRQVLQNDPSLQPEFVAAFREGPAAIVAMAATHGFDFTESEYVAEAARMNASGELTEDEMEMVSAGGNQAGQYPPPSGDYRGGSTDGKS